MFWFINFIYLYQSIHRHPIGWVYTNLYKQTTAKTDIKYLTHLTRKQLEISDKANRIPELKSELLLYIDSSVTCPVLSIVDITLML